MIELPNLDLSMFLLFTIKIRTSMDYRVTGNTQNEKQSQRASKSNKVASVKELTLKKLEKNKVLTKLTRL